MDEITRMNKIIHTLDMQLTQNLNGFKQQLGTWLCQDDYSLISGKTRAYIELKEFRKLQAENNKLKECLEYCADEDHLNHGDIHQAAVKCLEELKP